MADVGVPDGPYRLAGDSPVEFGCAFAGEAGANSISRGWRAGITLLPFAAGPSASFEYGAIRTATPTPWPRQSSASGFDGSPLLERVGYQYMNVHLGLDFGFAQGRFLHPRRPHRDPWPDRQC